MKPLHRVVSFVSWHRRAIAALLAALSVAGIVSVAQSPPPGERAVAASRPLPAGHTITDDDVTYVEVSPELVTASVLRAVEAAVGATTSIALDAGQLVTESALIAADPALDGRALVPISVQDPELRALLEPGATVSLIVALGEGPEVITDSARIAKLPSRDDNTLSLNQSGRGLVIVEVSADVAGTVATLGQSGQLVIVLGKL